MSLPALDEATLEDLYSWLERIPCTRHRKNYAHDFSDGVLLAELIHNFLPRIVDLHNYAPAAASVQKRYNWTALNKRVLSKLSCQLPNHVIQHVISGKPGAIEYVLLNVRANIDRILSAPKDTQLFLSRNNSSSGQQHNGSAGARQRTSSNSSRECATLSRAGASECASEHLSYRIRTQRQPTSSEIAMTAVLDNEGARQQTSVIRIHTVPVTGGSITNSLENIPGGNISGCRTPDLLSSPFSSRPSRGSYLAFTPGPGSPFCTPRPSRRYGGAGSSRSLTRADNKLSSPGGAEELVPSRLLYDANRKLLEKEEQVQVYQARITHLERLSELKDDRIGDLTARLDRLSQELFHQHNLNWTGMLAGAGTGTPGLGFHGNPGSNPSQNQNNIQNNSSNNNANNPTMSLNAHLNDSNTNSISTSSIGGMDSPPIVMEPIMPPERDNQTFQIRVTTNSGAEGATNGGHIQMSGGDCEFSPK